MLRAIYAATAVIASILAIACTSTNASLVAPGGELQPKCQLSAAGTPLSFVHSGGNGSVHITTARDCTWSISTSAAWISIIGQAAGQGEATVSYAVAANPVPAARSGSLRVGSQTIDINQGGAPCRFELSRVSDTIGAAGGQLSVAVTTLTGCSWSAASSASWISIVSGQSGNASGTIVLTVAPNAGAERVAAVNAAGQNYTVRQSAAAAPSAPGPSPTPPPPPPPEPEPAPEPVPDPIPGDTVSFSGAVANLSGKCPDLTFVVDGRTVLTDDDTRFKELSCRDVKDGRDVFVSGTLLLDEAVLASEVRKAHD
jgi:hypothetical protein